jgi:hypothetical protein
MTFAETPTKLSECFGDCLQHQPLQGKKNCQIDAGQAATQTKKHEQDTNQNLRGNFAKISASSQQQHPDHENLLVAKAVTQFLKSRHKPIITLCGFAYKSKNVRRTATMMDMKLLQLFS